MLLKKNEGGLIPAPSHATEPVWQLCQGPQSQQPGPATAPWQLGWEWDKPWLQPWAGARQQSSCGAKNQPKPPQLHPLNYGIMRPTRILLILHKLVQGIKKIIYGK